MTCQQLEDFVLSLILVTASELAVFRPRGPVSPGLAAQTRYRACCPDPLPGGFAPTDPPPGRLPRTPLPGLCPGPRWGLCPQTPTKGLCPLDPHQGNCVPLDPRYWGRCPQTPARGWLPLDPARGGALPPLELPPSGSPFSVL